MTQSISSVRCAASLSLLADSRAAVRQVCAAVTEQLGGAADLALTFFSPHHNQDAASLAATISDTLDTENLLGASGESIVGGDREIEKEPALVLWAARLPETNIESFELAFHQAEGGTFVGWPDTLNGTWPADSSLLLLGEPFSFPADVLLARLNEDRPDVLAVGGMASGGWAPGQNRLLLGKRVISAGAVAVLINGGVRVRTVVSQGCRPIGQPFVITKAEQNVIWQLSGKSAMEQLRAVFQTMSPSERQLIEHGLHVGRVINEYQDRFNRGDFLIRNVIGADPDAGSIAIGDFVRVGQTVQFHVRDAQSADDDLRELLGTARSNWAQAPLGALLFTCNGRGTRLFDQPDHDARVLREVLGDVPVAGFFAQGEIGPIGGKNFLHGFTASLAVFEPLTT